MTDVIGNGFYNTMRYSKARSLCRYSAAPHLTRADSYVRQPAYKRVDVGLSYELIGKEHRPYSGVFSHFKEIWLGVDCFNLLDISNVSSYYWVTDVNDIQYAVPNYLTRRQLNVRLSATFYLDGEGCNPAAGALPLRPGLASGSGDRGSGKQIQL